jgi:hydrogenase-4 transcriptional activator
MSTAVLNERASNAMNGYVPDDPLVRIVPTVWREACRHSDISEFTVKVTRLLSNRLPLSQVLVRRINPGQHCIETIAVGVPLPEYLLPEAITECSEQRMKELAAWSQLRKVIHREWQKPLLGPLAWMLPSEIDADIIFGSLGDPDQPKGILLLVGKPRESLDAQHVSLFKGLVEPFSTALDNHNRLRELTALRAAAEADKTSLLTKLGRREVVDAVIGADSGLRPVMERVELVARSDAPVLILGETGTGKEVIARLIHTKSPRAKGPFLRVNCGAIPSELIDSQLFGHERGAFTGAVEKRQGWFERADGGTLLLDELGELPLAAQVRLLRILQDGWLERVGSHQAIHVNVRIVAATNRDLATMVADGTFREDLWYRIAVFPIQLPPLRERREDIPALAQYYAEQAAAKFALSPVRPGPEEIQLLMSYAWPGNIREFGAVVDRAAILGKGTRLDVAQAFSATVSPLDQSVDGTDSTRSFHKGEISHNGDSHIVTAHKLGQSPPTRSSLELDAAMRQHIENVLIIAHGRIEGRRGAADLLKINPHTLRARMRKLGIDWAKFRRRDDE